ncbi:aromatic motif membrane protein [Metamycoplasma alkalescens]|uniref:aromatic motif membrane protein n=1 Tax=Metamycoplasma alkalescens TaxID=45363 RepID=UPI003D02EE1C
MKKLFLATNLAFIPIPIIAISCKKKNQDQNQTNESAENKEKFEQNQHINKLLDFFSNNQKEKKEIYLSQQKNKSDSKFNELKAAFVYEPIIVQDSISGATEYELIIRNSRNVIKNTLENDWYWVLNNIKKFEFVYNPYEDAYKAFKNEKEWFKKTNDTFKSIITKINNKFPNSLIEKELKDFDFKEFEKKFEKQAEELIKKYANDEEKTKKLLEEFRNKMKNILSKLGSFPNIYKEKQAWYLIFDENKAIRLWKYIKSNKNVIRINTDLLVFNNKNNIEEQIIDIENKIHQKRKDDFERQFKEYFDELFYEKYEEIEESENKFSEEVDENKEDNLEEKNKDEVVDLEKKFIAWAKDKNDEKYLEFKATHKYNSFFTKVINEINNDSWSKNKELKIFRFSMRSIDEKN